jgi:hypothetical protein
MLCVEKIPIIKLTLKLPTEDIGHIIYNFNQIDNVAGWHPTGCFETSIRPINGKSNSYLLTMHEDSLTYTNSNLTILTSSLFENYNVCCSVYQTG